MSPTRITVHDYSQPSFVACDVLQSPLVQTFTLEDSGYASGSSSPAFSEMSYHSDIERTPRSHYRPRAPSPLTPVTPDFSSIPNPLPPMHSPYKSPELDTPVSPTTSEPFPSFLSSASQTRLPHLSTPRSSSLDVARQGQPSKTRFRPIKNLILNRKRSLAAKDLHVPLSPTEPLPRGSLDDPRSFLDFKMPKRGLRRRNSEDILAAHKAGGELEYESFLSF
ncbi:hypothetical protein PsYK624_144640 [Phanerochaete sordida]|uniref:Uncharacterized protein n=1 Tax=Phanerochaete sordida TaxID=48140 RepID=A0A9P3GLY6_9APHY|nr:hypothetical protein PsYK624_144640 [Phanerochaete sordida]